MYAVSFGTYVHFVLEYFVLGDEVRWGWSRPRTAKAFLFDLSSTALCQQRMSMNTAANNSHDFVVWMKSSKPFVL